MTEDRLKGLTNEMSETEKTPEELLVDEILEDLTAIVDIQKKIAPKEWANEFLTRGMENNLDTLFQLFNTTKDKLELDFMHKPYFVDRNPETKLITVNGESFLNENDAFVKREQAVAEKYWRNEWYEIFHDEKYNKTALVIYIIIVLSIIISVVSTIASTTTLSKYADMWRIIEFVVTLCFTIEYIIKLILVRNRFKYMLRIMNVFDLLAILPFYLQEVFPADALESVGGVLRALRLTRIAKIRQLASPYTNIIMHATTDTIMGAGSSVAIFLFIGTVMTGTLVYAFEHDPDEADQFFTNIPMGMWFAVVTMTTVGYGDLYPLTAIGKCLGVLTILVGLILVSLVVMVVGNYYMDRLKEYEDGKEKIKEEIYYFSIHPAAKRHYTKIYGKEISWKTMLKHFPTEALFKQIWTGLRKEEEAKKNWWWSKLKAPGQVDRQHTFSQDDGNRMGSTEQPTFGDGEEDTMKSQKSFE